MSFKNKLPIGLFIIFISFFGSVSFFAKDQPFSERENRPLVQAPSFSWSRLVAGDFSKDVEEYIKDQFIGRDYWVGLKARAERLLLKQENNGIFFGKDGYLLEPFHFSREQLEKNLQYIHDFVDRANHITTYVMLAPTSVEFYSEKLPKFVATDSQLQAIRDMQSSLPPSISNIDIYDSLYSKKDQNIYFHTDHHWTMLGAYYAYYRAGETLGYVPYEIENFKREMVSDNFYGTYFSKANFSSIKADQIEIFQPVEMNVSYEVYFPDEDQVMNSLYAWNYLSTRDQYSVFLNGNHRLVKIKSSVENGRKLVVLKDSYAHAILPFLANHFAEIHVIDLRYYRTSVYDYLEENELEEVLFLYNIANFTTDTNLIWLKR